MAIREACGARGPVGWTAVGANINHDSRLLAVAGFRPLNLGAECFSSALELRRFGFFGRGAEGPGWRVRRAKKARNTGRVPGSGGQFQY